MKFDKNEVGGESVSEEVSDCNKESSSSSQKRGLEDYAVLFFFWILAVVVFIQFTSRYIFNNSIIWTEEIARYLLIYVTFIGSATAIRNRSHIRVEFLHHYLPEKVSQVVKIFNALIVIVFCACCSWLAFKVAYITKGQQMTSVNFSKAYLYGMVVVGFVLMTFRGVQLFSRNRKRNG